MSISVTPAEVSVESPGIEDYFIKQTGQDGRISYPE